jgi:HK97 family phage prohead protease
VKHVETKDFKLEFKDFDDRTGSFEAYISTKSIDSHNDRVLPTAFTRSVSHNKGKFPILWMHDVSKPLGSSTDIVIEKDGVRAFGKVNLDIELGRETYSGMKFDPPYIDRTSIGFVSVDDEYDRKTNIRTIKELKLMEFSLITRNFASNSEAMIQSVKADAPIYKRIEELEKRFGDNPELLFMLEHRLHELEQRMAGSLTSTQPTECSSDDTTHHEVKSVIGASDLPIASRDHEWDGPAAKKRIFEMAGDDMSKAKRAFFWIDGDPEAKGSFKLPFADVIDSKLQVVPRALSAVEGALNGARGGVEGIPDADKKAIMTKVNAYKKRMGDEPKMDPALMDVINNFKKHLRGDK